MKKNLSKLILDDLKKQIAETGSGLVKCDTREHAEKMFHWLEGKLPDNYGVWIIDAPGRENEINVYQIIGGGSKPSRNIDWRNSRTSKAVKMPPAFKKWKKSRDL